MSAIANIATYDTHRYGGRIDRALAHYQSVRAPISERIMRHGRKLGTHLGVDLATDEDRATWKMLQDYRAMMDWIAVPNFLAAS